MAAQRNRGAIAQLVERPVRNRKVAGSNPASSIFPSLAATRFGATARSRAIGTDRKAGTSASPHLALYAERVAPNKQSAHTVNQQAANEVRDPLAMPQSVLAARSRPMSERLELALSWNAVAAELRAGLAATLGQANPKR